MTSGKPSERPDYIRPELLEPEPGDEQWGAYSRERLRAMDAKFAARTRFAGNIREVYS